MQQPLTGMGEFNQPKGPGKLIKLLIFKWSQVDRRQSEKGKGLRVCMPSKHSHSCLS